MAQGKVAQIIGTVVDIEFPPDELPELFNAVEIDNSANATLAAAQQEEGNTADKLIVEVQQHLGNNLVRCLAMGSTDGMRRGAQAIDTGSAITVPVGPQTLGRLFNVLGQPLDTLGALVDAPTLPIHRSPPAFDEQ
jgi:F-type H+/Na+-transporting ATPase subunit beta